jgi:hypothetical protein
MSGTGHIVIGYSDDLLNRILTGMPKNSTVIDRPWETGRNDLQDQTIKNNLGDFSCPHETKSYERAIDFNRQRQFVTMRAC